MRYIEKGHVPASLTAQRKTPGASYTASDELRDALAHEQGYICAFCMRKLDLSAKKGKDGRPKTIIAHLLSRHPQDTHSDSQKEKRRILGMTYRNLVLACDGHTGDIKHCDQYQGNADVTIPLFDRTVMNQITFSTGGQVIHPVYQNQIGSDDNSGGLLNLNASVLTARRRERWLTVATLLRQQGRWTEGELEKELESWSKKDAEGLLKEDCQCISFFLQQKLRILRQQPKAITKKVKR